VTSVDNHKFFPPPCILQVCWRVSIGIRYRHSG